MTAAYALALIAAAQQTFATPITTNNLTMGTSQPRGDCCPPLSQLSHADREAALVDLLKQAYALIDRQQERIDMQHRQIGEMNDKLADLIKKCGATKQ